MTDAERLVERLLKEVHRGRFQMGGGTISRDGTGTSWGGEKIMELLNPNGPEAAATIQQQAARIGELEGLLREAKDICYLGDGDTSLHKRIAGALEKEKP